MRGAHSNQVQGQGVEYKLVHVQQWQNRSTTFLRMHAHRAWRTGPEGGRRQLCANRRPKGRPWSSVSLSDQPNIGCSTEPLHPPWITGPLMAPLCSDHWYNTVKAGIYQNTAWQSCRKSEPQENRTLLCLAFSGLPQVGHLAFQVTPHLFNLYLVTRAPSPVSIKSRAASWGGHSVTWSEAFKPSAIRNGGESLTSRPGKKYLTSLSAVHTWA